MVLRIRHTGELSCQLLLLRFEYCLARLTVMKNTTNAMEYWSELMFKSSVMPATLAFPMLVRCLDGQLLTNDHSMWVTDVHVTQEIHDPDAWQERNVDLPHESLLLCHSVGVGLCRHGLFGFFDILDVLHVVLALAVIERHCWF
jgi:hypothetical protein